MIRGLVLLSAILTVFPAAAAGIDSLAAWEGEVEGEQFGIALALGGDADGDGRADLAVGSSTSDEGGANAGKVSIFLGRSLPDGTPDLEIVGRGDGGFFGAAVAWAGDVNGDGYGDLLVGAYRDDEAGSTAGKAYIYFGGSPMDSIPDRILIGPGAGAYFGRAVTGAGDLNGDLYDDWAVGAPRTANGDVYVYFGAADPDTTPDAVLTGAAAGDRFGEALGSPGNVDGIAGDELLVGAPRASVRGTWSGAVHLFSGGPVIGPSPIWTAFGPDAGDQLGAAVAGAGDVNGDGDSDILAGAPYANDGSFLDAGAAYVYYGGSAIDTTADFVVRGPNGDANAGASVAGCADVTGSGFGHILVGAPGATSTGEAILSPGGDPPLTADLLVLSGESTGDRFGHAVAGAGMGSLSFTGGSAPDVAVGAWSHGLFGKTYLYGESAVTGVASAGPPSPSMLRIAPNPGRRFSFFVDPSSAAGKYETGNPWTARIYDAAGRRVAGVSGVVGRAEKWDGRDRRGRLLPPGVYFYRIEGARESFTSGRIILVR